MRLFSTFVVLWCTVSHCLPAQQSSNIKVERQPDTIATKEPYVMEFLSNRVRYEPDDKRSRELTFRAGAPSESAVAELWTTGISFRFTIQLPS